jgi:pimeloyl-ACP methyl ester carboxylesterase
MSNQVFDATGRLRKGRSCLQLILLIFLALLIIPPILGMSYQFIASAIDQTNFPPPGQLVDVGGYKLHIRCTGEGDPTVILDAANQGTVSNWVWIQSEIAKTTRVCAYDRAGLGWSDLSPDPQDTQQNTEVLHTLLNRAGIQGPYVLVGHSLGGLYTRMFQELYPDEVLGMVFIEGTHPNALKVQSLPDVMPNAPDEGMMDAASIVSRLGLLRLLSFPPTDPDLPEQQRLELKAYLASTKWSEMIKRQYHLFPTLLAQIRPLYLPGSVGDIPLAVILGSEGDGGISALEELFKEQAALSTTGIVHRIEGATHISLVDRQEHAQQSAAIILDIVNAADK